jgi:hypothetical protein
MKPQHWLVRYCEAHIANFKANYPTAFKDGHYTPPVPPRVKGANGLTLAIVNFLNWSGHNATRINTMGRPVETFEKVAYGTLRTKKYIPSQTRKGTADITATIRGRSVKIEVKAGNDKPSPDQLKEQIRELNAGGIYEFVSDMDQFFNFYDQWIL